MLSRTDYWLLCGDVQRRGGNVKSSVMLVQTCIFPGGGGEGEGTSFRKSYSYVPLQKIRCLCRFGLKTGIDYAHFGLESGMVFEGTTVVYEGKSHNGMALDER